MLEWAYPTLLHNTFCKCSRFSVLGKLAFSQYSFIAKMRKIVLFDHIRLSCPFIFCRASFLSFASFSATACKCPSQVRLLQRLSRSIVADELDSLLFISEFWYSYSLVLVLLQQSFIFLSPYPLSFFFVLTFIFSCDWLFYFRLSYFWRFEALIAGCFQIFLVSGIESLLFSKRRYMECLRKQNLRYAFHIFRKSIVCQRLSIFARFLPRILLSQD